MNSNCVIGFSKPSNSSTQDLGIRGLLDNQQQSSWGIRDYVVNWKCAKSKSFLSAKIIFLASMCTASNISRWYSEDEKMMLIVWSLHWTSTFPSVALWTVFNGMKCKIIISSAFFRGHLGIYSLHASSAIPIFQFRYSNSNSNSFSLDLDYGVMATKLIMTTWQRSEQ